MLAEEDVCLIYHLLSDHHACQVLLQNDLESKEECLVPFSSSTFKVGEESCRVWRILKVVGYLVRIRQEQCVDQVILHIDHPHFLGILLSEESNFYNNNTYNMFTIHYFS